MRVLKPPFHLVASPESFQHIFSRSVFLAGSIENNTAPDWQKDVEQLLEDTDFLVFNPRRDDWDPTWEPVITNPAFVKQVEWEITYLRSAHYKLFYFAPDTLAPISLLEFGGIAMSQPSCCVVVCPEPYWKKGNIDVVCRRFNVKQVSTLVESVEWLKKQIKEDIL